LTHGNAQLPRPESHVLPLQFSHPHTRFWVFFRFFAGNSGLKAELACSIG